MSNLQKCQSTNQIAWGICVFFDLKCVHYKKLYISLKQV